MKNLEMPDLYEIFRSCSGVGTDSRKIEKGTMFFALKGENFNGNHFAKGALEQGAAYAVIDDEDVYNANSLQDITGYSTKYRLSDLPAPMERQQPKNL